MDATESSLKAIQTRLQSNVETHNLESARAMYEHKKKRKRKV